MKEPKSKVKVPKRKVKASDTEEVLPKEFSKLVIAVSGTIPGNTHAGIEKMINEMGAQFEKLDINSCTHLVTTRGQVENVRSEKVRNAMSSEGCEIVSMEWLLRSIEKKKVADVKKHRLWKPTKSEKLEDELKVKTEVAVKRKRPDDDLREENGSPQKTKLIDSRDFVDLSRLVDEAYCGERDNVAVYKDVHGVIWDATLLKPCRDSGRYGVLILRIQLLYNSESKKYRVWTLRKSVANKSAERNCTKWSRSETAIAEFERLFNDASGLKWAKPPQEPKKDRYWLIERVSEHEGGRAPDLDIQAPPSMKNCEAFFDMIVGVQHTVGIDTILRGLLNYLEQKVTTERNLGLALSLLVKMTRLCESNDLSSVPHHHLGVLSECLRGVLAIPVEATGAIAFASASDGDFQWVPRALEHLTFFKNLTTVLNIMHRAKKTSKEQRAQEVYRTLGLKSIASVSRDSSEYSALARYFDGSLGSSHQKATIVNILRIERHGEARRFSQFQRDNKTSVGKRYLLWHGSPSPNFIGILAQGFRNNSHDPSSVVYPPRGLYFADFAGKSVGFCCAKSGQMALLVLCEVELGKKVCTDINALCTGLDQLSRRDYLSVFVQGRVAFNAWENARCIHEDLEGALIPNISRGQKGDAGSFNYNEYVVHDPVQIRQRYLVQILIH